MNPIEKAMEDYRGPNMVFDPIPSYDGVWEFRTINLSKNSLKKDGKNLFDEFLRETFTVPMEGFFGFSQISRMSIKMISMPNENMIGRTLRYSKVDFFLSVLAFLNHEVDRYGKTKEEQEEYLKELFKKVTEDNATLNTAFAAEVEKKACIYEEVATLGAASEYYEALAKDYSMSGSRISIREFARINAKNFRDYAIGLSSLGDFFDTNLDIGKLYSCFDPDTFYLMFAKIVYEQNLKNYGNNTGLNNNYSILMNYLDGCKEVGKRYNPKIPFVLDNDKTTKISRWQLEVDTKELMTHYPEAKPIMLPELDGSEADKYRDINLLNKLMKLYDTSSQVSWEFLPKGEKIARAETITPRKKRESSKEPIDYTALIEEVNKRISFLEHTDFIGTPIKGLDTFSGYYAFVYPNGKVVLEKFWENEETLIPATSCATYVMTIDNFVEMSKNSKPTLIEYIRLLPEVGVKRLFHSSFAGWQKSVTSEIEGSYRLEDAIEFINSLKTGASRNE